MKINIQNSKAQAELDALQAKCNARTLSAADLMESAEWAEKLMTDTGIPKKFWPGTKVTVFPWRVPNSYNYRAEGTKAIIQRGTTGWFLVSRFRAPVSSVSYGSDSMPDHISIPETPELLSAILRARNMGTHKTA